MPTLFDPDQTGKGMISTGLMVFLILAYGAITLASLWERNWPRALYFVGAILITIAVLWIQKR